ncbi:hypothetical protein FRX31_022347 [Thalictrum thalictroides]|uniref:Uncharacterized protein n=1 Tax=Thalictrum thalictroides TaxID=46969 RepID=A0A7J6VSI8_THATH|nr:hypothetical protein FRX31_022347 [Thalictrum thalictroides]
MDHCHSVGNQYFDSSQLPEKIVISKNTKSYSSLASLLSQTGIQDILFWTVSKDNTMHFILSPLGIKILRGIFKYLRDLYKDKRHHGNLYLANSIMVRHDYFTKIDNLFNESDGAIKDLGDLRDFVLSRFHDLSNNGFLKTSISHLIHMINTLQRQCDPNTSNATSKMKADLIV